MPKIFIETNFSFPKLARKFKSIEKKSRADLYKKEAKSAKKMLSQGKVKPPLTKSNPMSRSKAEFAKYGKKPLYKTKVLYKSIRGDEEGLHMIEYGRMHNNGEGRNTQRRFVNKFDKKAQERYTEALIEEIHKALKK
tara:strand:- start:237 stop:647 length:411 start_codon:yes stop_codon:yes gene_type:complete